MAGSRSLELMPLAANQAAIAVAHGFHHFIANLESTKNVIGLF
jgi:hypothetical protein